MLKLLLAAVLLGIVAAQEKNVTAVHVTPTEEVLVRCTRPVCSLYCPFGQQLDSTGCPICQCLSDPCLEAKCPPRKKCQPKESCTGHPCTELPFTCDDVPCPQVMCAVRCEYGLEKNQYGCDTCKCIKNPCNNVECNADQECKVIDDPACPRGAYCNKVGKCFAVPNLRIPEEPMLPKCPLTQCQLLCRFGFKTNEKGCNECKCKTNPCDDVKCGDGEKCKHNPLDSCQHDICDLQPKCSVQPICEHMRQVNMDKMKMTYGLGGPKVNSDSEVMAKPLECDESGNFQPRQCHHVTGDCWCVNDLGEEVEGTRRSANHVEGKPHCPYNKTQTVKGQLQLHHDISGDLVKHYAILRPILVMHLGEWMMIQEKYIQEVVVTPYGTSVQTLKVDFVITGEIEDDIDLASSVHHLHLKVKSEETLIHYNSFTLIPVPRSLETHHKFQAEPMAVPVDEKLTNKTQVVIVTNTTTTVPVVEDKDSVLEYYKVHKTVIVILIGLVLLSSILVVLLVQVAKRRRVLKLQRRDNYQQNLAFTNEVYGKLAFLDDLAKDKVPDAEKNEATA